MGTSASRAAKARIRTLTLAAVLAALLAFSLVPAGAFAASGDEAAGIEGQPESLPSEPSAADGTGVGASASVPDVAGGDSVGSAQMLASSLVGDGTSVISADVALSVPDEGSSLQPVVASFTVDGMTYALSEDGATLVAVAPGALAVDGPDGGRGEVPPSGTSFASGSSEPSAPSGPSAIPASVSYGDAAYDVTAIGPYAFYLSGATEVALPTSIASVDERAFRSSDVAWVDVDPANPTLASFDGALYSADLSSLLLIPEGRAGSVSIPCEAEVVESSKFSHCSLVDAISVDGDGAAFASWEGLLYDGAGTTLLRVPAGATDITIREGCTTIAAGAMEGCAKLETIEAPASVTSISPDVFSQETPTVSLPAAALAEESGEAADREIAQLSALIALSESVGAVPKVDPAAIMVALPDDAPRAPWAALGVAVEGGAEGASAWPLAVAIHSEDVVLSNEERLDGDDADEVEENLELPAASLESAEAYAADYGFTLVAQNGVKLFKTNKSGTSSTEVATPYKVSCGAAGHVTNIRITAAGESPVFQVYHSSADDNSYYRWEKPGYTIAGIQVDGANGESETLMLNGTATVKGTIKGTARTITPIWSANTISVTFIADGVYTDGSTGSHTFSTTYAEGKTMADLWWQSVRPFNSNYTFRGWYTKENGEGVKYESTTPLPTKDTTLYAWFQANVYKVYLNRNFSSSDTDLHTTTVQTLYYRYTDTCFYIDEACATKATASNVKKASWAGHIFLGYYSARSGGSQLIDANGAPATLSAGGITSDTSLYAQWKEQRLTLEGNGGKIRLSGTNQSWDTFTALWQGNWAVFSNGTVHYVTTGGPTNIMYADRAGYTFDGWDGIDLGGQDSVMGTDPDLRLVARWTPNKIEVIWNPNGGFVDGNAGPFSRSTSYGEDKVLKDIWDPVFWEEGRIRRTGYSFKGWFTDPAGGTQVQMDTPLPTSDMECFAHWERRSYDVKFDANGGTMVGAAIWTPSNPQISFDTGSWSGIPAPTRAGYTFQGFYTERSGGTRVYAPNNGGALATNDGTYWKDGVWSYDGSPTFYAQWKGNTIWCRFNPNGGQLSNGQTTTAAFSTTYGEGKTISDAWWQGPSRNGYRFKGWFTAASGGEQVYANTPLPTKDTTYYAQWIVNVSASVPVSVTAEVDLLGIEEPTEATGYIESRSGGALKVAEVSFEPKQGADDLFGDRVADVFLEAFADGSTQADYRFALDAAANETDASKLASFALPNGYGTRVGIGYRFAIPSDVISSLDASRFEGVTTPVGQVVYTVALA